MVGGQAGGVALPQGLDGFGFGEQSRLCGQHRLDAGTQTRPVRLRQVEMAAEVEQGDLADLLAGPQRGDEAVGEIGLVGRLVPGLARRMNMPQRLVRLAGFRQWASRRLCHYMTGSGLWPSWLRGISRVITENGARSVKNGLSATEERMLNEVPSRGTAMPPTDPLLYRFYEMLMVNGPAWKALIEEFGDGIMSAIDFEMQIDREPNPKGDRVKITMSGKFLPYKCYAERSDR